LFVSAVVVAAGRGLRFDGGGGGGRLPKQLLPLGGRPLVSRTAEVFASHPDVSEVVVVAPPDLADEFAALASLPAGVRVVAGGASRTASMENGLAAVSPECDVVLVHDGVRPLVAGGHISRVVAEAAGHGAAILAVPESDTLKLADEDGFIVRTVSRASLWRAQTPQGFRREVLTRALDRFREREADQAGPAAGATDEASLVEAMGARVRLVEGSPDNLKITSPPDLLMAEKLLPRPDSPPAAFLSWPSSPPVPEASAIRAAGGAGPAAPMAAGGRGARGSSDNLAARCAGGSSMAEKTSSAEKASSSTPGESPLADLRVGQGFDFHRFDRERPLYLGCVLIPDEPGLLGHSDADVLSHALIDALLGAAGLGDIGTVFPPSEDEWRGASGSLLLSMTKRLLNLAGFRLVNADLTVIGETPRVGVHREPMLEALSEALGEDKSRLNLKGKTTEGLGFLGRGEGLAASAAVLLLKEDQKKRPVGEHDGV
jgi:2-C-methyl-D-erythritol 4-phosphate cytidylyltransferase/2-C-methyl-D-erythritol 2,4-cyclodiphosphate synthase